MLSKILFSDEATFHVHGKVNRHNVRVWGPEQPWRVTEHERDSPKENMFCVMSKTKIYGPLFFAEKTIGGFSYLAMLQSWLFPQLVQDEADIILQQDGAPPHFHREVRSHLNETLPHRWICRGTDNDDMFLTWPPRSPDLTLLDFYFWGYVKNKVYVPPLPRDLREVRERITNAVASISMDDLVKVCDELEYKIDVCRVTHCAHI
jgi:hypothetical protein